MKISQKNQDDMEHAVLLAKTVMKAEDVQNWVSEPVPAWGNRSPLRVIMDGEKNLVWDWLQQQPGKP